MRYRVFLNKQNDKPDNELLIKMVDRSRLLLEDSEKTINIKNPFLLRFIKRRFKGF